VTRVSHQIKSLLWVLLIARRASGCPLTALVN